MPEFLKVIPATVFQCLIRIIKLQTVQVPEVPTRLDKDKLKDYAQLDGRYEVCRKRNGIAKIFIF